MESGFDSSKGRLKQVVFVIDLDFSGTLATGSNLHNVTPASGGAINLATDFEVVGGTGLEEVNSEVLDTFSGKSNLTSVFLGIGVGGVA